MALLSFHLGPFSLSFTPSLIASSYSHLTLSSNSSIVSYFILYSSSNVSTSPRETSSGLSMITWSSSVLLFHLTPRQHKLSKNCTSGPEPCLKCVHIFAFLSRLTNPIDSEQIILLCDSAFDCEPLWSGRSDPDIMFSRPLGGALVLFY